MNIIYKKIYHECALYPNNPMLIDLRGQSLVFGLEYRSFLRCNELNKKNLGERTCSLGLNYSILKINLF